MTEAPLMLGVSGCRGIVGESLTPEVVTRYAAAFGDWLQERCKQRATIVLGRDGRAGGAILRDAARAGLCGVGCDVVDLGIEMTPTVGVMVDALEADGGVILTASHNPQEWNGLKCIVRDHRESEGSGGVFACAPNARMAGEILERFKSQKNNWQPWHKLGSTSRQQNAATLHVERIVARFEENVLEALASMKPTVVLDSVNGAGIRGGRLLLERLGCRVVHLGAEDTGIFCHAPEPTKENLSGTGGICQAVREHGALVGFAQDPDADRLAVIDERGTYIGEEYTLALTAREVFDMGMRGAERQSRASAVNLSTSRMIDDIAAEYGVEIQRTPVGEANVVEAMKQHDMVIGGEGNGGMIWSSVSYIRDSLGAMALILASIARQNTPVSNLVAKMPAYAIEKRKVRIARRTEAEPAIKALVHWAQNEEKECRLDTQDGVRVDWTECEPAGGGPAWVHVRASNTEPILRLIGEARTTEGIANLLDTVEKTIG